MICNMCIHGAKAYFPPEREYANPFASGSLIALDPRAFRIADTNMLVSKKSRRPNMNCDQPNVSLIASGEIWLRWPAFVLGSRWACRFQVVCLLFPHIG